MFSLKQLLITGTAPVYSEEAAQPVIHLEQNSA